MELLTAIAHYHRTGEPIGLSDTVNFGRPWHPSSECSYGLVSLPYLDGPGLEVLKLEEARHPVRFLWLIPITNQEVDFKRRAGIEKLEQAFEAAQFDYLDPHRDSVAG